MEPFPPESPAIRVVECPHCDTPREVSLTTAIYPGSRELADLFRGRLNRADCHTCTKSFLLDVPLLYRDDERHYLIYLLPKEDCEDWRTGEQHMAKLTAALFAQDEGITPPDCRLVTDRRALIEKIALHQRGLDDRLIEYIKYQLHNNPNAEHCIDAVRHCLLFDFSNAEEEILAFLVYDRERGGEPAGAHLPMDVYTEVNEAFRSSPDMRRELEALFPGYFVSVDRLL